MNDSNISPFGNQPNPDDLDEDNEGTEDDAAYVSPAAGLLKDTSKDDTICEITDEIRELKARRTSINEQVTAKLKDYEAEGLDRDAMKLLIKMQDWSPEKRQIFDTSMKVGRRALQLPEQTDMFEDAKPQHNAA